MPRGRPRISVPGPWGSLVPTLPSVPSQALEGIATLAILAILALALMAGAFGRRDGRLFFVAIGLWALARAAVSTTWRDPVVAGGLNAAGLIAIGIAIGCVVAVVALSVRRRRCARRVAAHADRRVRPGLARPRDAPAVLSGAPAGRRAGPRSIVVHPTQRMVFR